MEGKSAGINGRTISFSETAITAEWHHRKFDFKVSSQ